MFKVVLGIAIGIVAAMIFFYYRSWIGQQMTKLGNKLQS
jgi:biopolymer transport protein ExbB/TolQ